MITVLNIEISTDLGVLLLLSFSLGIFIISQTLKLYINPASLINSPSSENAMENVDKSSTRSIAIFSIVLVIIQFTLPNTADLELGFWGVLTVSVLTLSASFLMISFVLEIWGSRKNYLFNLQQSALRYAGLLLFVGLYFLLTAEGISGLNTAVFAFFLLGSWTLWILHEIDYIFNIERKEWIKNNYDSKYRCLKIAASGFKKKMFHYYEK